MKRKTAGKNNRQSTSPEPTNTKIRNFCSITKSIFQEILVNPCKLLENKAKKNIERCAFLFFGLLWPLPSEPSYQDPTNPNRFLIKK